ncbi:hypothetical protein WS65_19735 [Burkholderia anthina]|nr:hypothetical protein WS65_19735 [Burkholderia anthina]
MPLIKKIAAISEQYYDLAQARYRGGTDRFLTLLDAQPTLYAAQRQRVTDMLARQSNLITLYKVLGGGWRETSAVTQRSLRYQNDVASCA